MSSIIAWIKYIFDSSEEAVFVESQIIHCLLKLLTLLSCLFFVILFKRLILIVKDSSWQFKNGSFFLMSQALIRIEKPGEGHFYPLSHSPSLSLSIYLFSLILSPTNRKSNFFWRLFSSCRRDAHTWT